MRVWRRIRAEAPQAESSEAFAHLKKAKRQSKAASSLLGGQVLPSRGGKCPLAHAYRRPWVPTPY